MRLLREDVHIHATPQAIFDRLRAPELGGWFDAVFSRPGADGELAFELAMPLHREVARLAITTEQAPALLVMAADGDDDDLSALSWALHVEREGEVHLTVEVAYRPARGLLVLLEPLLYVPRRKQLFRDALWRLKLLVEGGEAADGDRADGE